MNSRPLMLGHRGCRARKYNARENTIAAFHLALQHGCDGFEFDVRLTIDGCPVICHNAKSSGIEIAKAAAESLERLPSLDEVLESFAGRAFLDIELKVPGVAKCVLSALSQHPPRHGCVVSSFLPEVLSELRKQDESLPLGIICETRYELARWPKLPVQYVIVKESLVNQQLVHAVHSAAKQLFVWTVNGKRSMLRFADWGVDGIISDRTDLLAATLAGSSEK